MAKWACSYLSLVPGTVNNTGFPVEQCRPMLGEQTHSLQDTGLTRGKGRAELFILPKYPTSCSSSPGEEKMMGGKRLSDSQPSWEFEVTQGTNVQLG